MLQHLLRRFALICCATLLLIGCTDGAEPVAESPTEAPTTSDVIVPTETVDSAPTVGFADVNEIELQMLESFPVQINAVARGQLADGCTTITTIEQARNAFTYSVTINTLRDPSNGCTADGAPFEESVALDVLDIPAGTYAVNVNGVQQAFVLSADNSAIQPTAPIPPTPNRHKRRNQRPNLHQKKPRQTRLHQMKLQQMKLTLKPKKLLKSKVLKLKSLKTMRLKRMRLLKIRSMSRLKPR